jgi:phosphohistidine phosphatase
LANADSRLAMAATKQLFLLRHAKSSWKDAELPDHDRPLARRGRRASKLMSKHLRRHELQPKLVLCSSATRARETLERVRPSGDVWVEEQLYLASAAELLTRLRRVPETFDSVMLIGHSPAIETLALALADHGEPPAALVQKFPTGALATLAFDGDWAELRPGCAELISFVKPTDLG